MNTETLQGIGLNDEQIRSVMAEYGKEINPLKQAQASAEQERDSLKSQLEDVNGQLSEAQKNSKKGSELQASSRTYKSNLTILKPKPKSNYKQLRKTMKLRLH